MLLLCKLMECCNIEKKSGKKLHVCIQCPCFVLVLFAKAEFSVVNLYNITKVNLHSRESKSIRTTFTSLLTI